MTRLRLLLFLLLLFPISLRAQTGAVTGVALDSVGNTVAGATITVCAVGSPGIPCAPVTASTTSNGQGAFSVTVPIGTYTVTVFRLGVVATSSTVVVAPSNITIANNVTYNGTVTFTGNNTMTAGQNQFNAFIINGCHIVDGTKYAQTDVGVNAAITDAKADNSNCVKLGMNPAGGQTYVFSNTVTIAAGSQNTTIFTFDMTNAVVHCEFTGTCIRFGETANEHSHVRVLGGTVQRTNSGAYFHDFSPCATCPSASVVSTGVEWLNINGGQWSGGFNIIGFRNGLYVRSSNTHSSYYNVFFPEYLFDNLIDYLFQPNNDTNGGVNDNYVSGGEAQKATDSFDFSSATNGAPGGNCIVVNNDTNPLVTFVAQANVFDTSCESAVTTAARKPEAAVYINGGGNDFRIYAEGFTKNAWIIDNSVQAAVSPGGADILFNRFTAKSGGGPIAGLSVFRTNSGTVNTSQTIIGQRSLVFSGGNGCTATPCQAGTDPMFVLQETNNTSNKAVEIRNASGNSVFVQRSDGAVSAGTAGLSFHGYPLFEQGQCTLSSGTCTVANSSNFFSTPRCFATWNGTGTLTGIVKAVASSGSSGCVVTSSVGGDTGVMQVLAIGNPN